MTSKLREFDEAVLAAAESWIVRLRSDHATTADEQAFALWIGQNPNHRNAFDEVLSVWEAMGSAPVSANAPNHSSHLIAAKVHPLPPRPSSHVSGQTTDSRAQGANSRWRALFAQSSTGIAAIAASVVVVAMVLLTQLESPYSVAPTVQHYETSIGAQRQLTLDDGSIIQLNTNTHVEIRYTADARQVKLLQGEAFFQVAKDASRPFTVITSNGSATALGTAFNVHSDSGLTTVTVTEGVVRIASLDEANHLDRIAEKGQQVKVKGRALGLVEAVDTSSITAWRDKTLVFNDTDLAQALNELNRYLVRPVDTSDPSLDALRVSGTFSLDDPETTLQAIIESFELQFSTNTKGQPLRLYR